MSQTKEADGVSTTRADTQRRLRLLIRLTCLVIALLCLLPVRDKVTLLALVPSLSSFLALSSGLACKTLQPLLILGLSTGIVTCLKHRWFCRWACPLGLCLDSASWLGRVLKRKPSQGMVLGQCLCLLTLGGAALGIPLFLWLDPLALFAGAFMLSEQGLFIMPILLLVLLLMISVLRPHAWCRSICPLGAFQDLLSLISRSVRALAKPGTEPTSSRLPIHARTRRSILGLLAGAGTVGILRITGGQRSRPLRPPGAVDEDIIRGLCTRCSNCLRACPYDVVHHHTDHRDLTSVMTPVLSFDKDYCREDCTRCTQVCPSGALTQVNLDAKADVRIGRAQVDMRLCLLGEDRECSACMRWCPYNAVRYIFSEIEYALIPTIDPNKCNGCGACELACPTNPQKAIRVVPNARVS